MIPSSRQLAGGDGNLKPEGFPKHEGHGVAGEELYIIGISRTEVCAYCRAQGIKPTRVTPQMDEAWQERGIRLAPGQTKRQWDKSAARSSTPEDEDAPGSPDTGSDQQRSERKDKGTQRRPHKKRTLLDPVKMDISRLITWQPRMCQASLEQGLCAM